MNIVDVENIADIAQSPTDAAFKAARKNSLVNGMSPDAHLVFKKTCTDMTKVEMGVSDKKIIIPSFNTTSKLFAQHFQILRELRHKIDLLKQAYENQRSMDRSWEQIDDILNILA